MTREDTIAVLRAHAEELHSLGVAQLSLFGSTERGDEHAGSDIDLLVDFDPARQLSLLDLAELRLRLSDLLGRDVDLVQRDHLKPYLRESVLAEARNLL